MFSFFHLQLTLIKTFSHIVTIDRSRLSMLIIWGQLRLAFSCVIKHCPSLFNYYLISVNFGHPYWSLKNFTHILLKSFCLKIIDITSH